MLMSTRPDPTVFATAVPKVNAATKLKNDAQMTALPGLSTRVETTVAIELAASWNPLMKSKASATPISAMTARRFVSIRSGVLDHDAFEDVGDVLAAIGGLLEKVQDLLPLHDDDRVLLLVEQRLHGRLMRAIRLVLEAVDLDGAFGDPVPLLERLDRADHLVGRVEDQARQLPCAGANAFDVVKPDDRG